MSTLMGKISLLGLSAVVLAGSLAPAQAMPLTSAPVVKSDVQTVQYWRDDSPYWGRRGYYREGYYGGYRGYRERREGYRYHNGYWFPLAAFATGAIIGGALAQPRYVAPAPRYVAPAPRYVVPSGGLNPRHVRYCQGRYRSYDVYSNTFQPYHGPRQQCYSPYY
ncbi:BA14K family protein [Rhizobium helianthi]|uniref:Lectin-like protein BA14k n=1 Tax=Rhizobium helianthi TaxID=1132695 RepID=A0ABW4M7L5_9HYPH